jgi:hypothetical protein
MIIRLEKSIKQFIPNYNEFIDILNENCIIYGRFILHFINRDDVKVKSIDILSNYLNFIKLHKLLSINRFTVQLAALVIDSLHKNSTQRIIYEKYVNNAIFTLQVNITPNMCNFFKNDTVLKIERSYFNGSHVVIPFKKEVFTKNETNTNIKFTNPEIHKKLQYYIKYGYMFTIINDIEHIDYKNVLHRKSQFITDLLAYKFK